MLSSISLPESMIILAIDLILFGLGKLQEFENSLSEP